MISNGAINQIYTPFTMKCIEMLTQEQKEALSLTKEFAKMIIQCFIYKNYDLLTYMISSGLQFHLILIRDHLLLNDHSFLLRDKKVIYNKLKLFGVLTDNNVHELYDLFPNKTIGIAEWIHKQLPK